MSVGCPKCRQENPETVQFCTRCHTPLRYVCPACRHVQGHGGTCDVCGVDFLKFGMAQIAQARMRSESENARLERRTSFIREALLAIVTGGFSLLKFLRARR